MDVDGRLVLSQRIRTVSKAHAALVDQVVEVIGDRPAGIAVHHVDNAAGADAVGATLSERLPQLASPTVTDMGPVLGVHVGAGAIGVCVSLDPAE
jgi:fatty acid-binding protein DegV